MKSSLLWTSLAALALLVLGAACSDQNAPVDRAHRDGWGLAHGADPGARGPVAGCRSCHGSDLGGGSAGVACLDCHLEGPPFANHPAGYRLTHGADPSAQGAADACQGCHGANVSGGIAAVACLSCHLEGPPFAGHPDGYPLTHGADASAAGAADACKACHGSDLGGGFVGVACLGCHLEGPPFGGHPDGYLLSHGGDARAAEAADACKACHGDDLGGGFVGVACLDCHLEGPPFSGHPDGYLLTHGAADDVKEAGDACGACHGSDLAGGAVGVGCFDCHTGGNPLLPENRPCLSCHGSPPDSPSQAPAAGPNRAGAHAAHKGLITGADACSVCHDGAGAGTAAHWDEEVPADVALVRPEFQGRRGSARYDFDAASGTGTCANVSCHGGRTTPLWLGGSLDAATECGACHERGTGAGVPEANSYYSGLHELHLQAAQAICTACHDAARLASGHFTGLESPEFEQPPAQSLRADMGYDAAAQTCLTSSAGCHPGVLQEWNGAPHPVNAQWLLPSGTPRTSHVLRAIEEAPACIACHTLTGGGEATPCGTCHNAPTAIAFAVGQCGSCHNRPPDAAAPAGNARPNRAGAHDGHAGLTSDTQSCAACHQGAGSNTLQHYDPAAPATVALLTPRYQGKRGPVRYDFEPASGTGTCANISCHGGRTTPPWLGGTLAVATGCAACHELGSASDQPEANSYFSGRHETHEGYAAGFSPTCSACHQAARLAAGHFAGLDTPGFEGSPAASLAVDLGYDAVSGRCLTQTAGCHPGAVRPWDLTHPVDAEGSYLDPAAHGSDAKADLASCQECHGEAGGPGSNPRFNIGIVKAGGQGCEGCHNDGTAHPSAGGQDGAPWYDRPFFHRDAALEGVGCALCHGANLQGGAGPACAACHPASPVENPSGCVSCHSLPPNGSAPAGNVRPNRAGRHGRFGHSTLILSECTVCHSTGGFGTEAHFDGAPPADIAAPPVTGGAFPTDITFSPGTPTTCTGLCHGFPHPGLAW